MDCRVKPGNDDLKLAPMGLDPRIHRLRKKSLVERDGLHRTSGMPEVRIIVKRLKSGKPD
jgi:hypothetical protein